MTGPFLVSYVVLWVLVVVEFVAIFALYNHFGQMALSSREGRVQQGPPEGLTLKQSDLSDVRGRTVTLPLDVASLVLFTSIDCQPCKKLLPHIDALSAARDDVKVVVICKGQDDEVEKWAAPLDPGIVLIADPEHQISSRYGIGVTPFCVVTDASGVVQGKGVVNDGGDLDQAAARAVASQVVQSGAA